MNGIRTYHGERVSDIRRAREKPSFSGGTHPLGRNVADYGERAPGSRWALAHAERHQSKKAKSPTWMCACRGCMGKNHGQELAIHLMEMA